MTAAHGHTADAALRLLGPLCLEIDGRSVPLGGPRQRAVLALLAMDANRTIPVDRIIVDLWDDDHLRQPRNNVQVYVSNLRRILRPVEHDLHIVADAGGYRLEIATDVLDLERFRSLHAEAVRQRDRGLADAAARAVGRALALWRGPFLDDLAVEFDVFSDAADRLAEEHLAALELRNDLELTAGRPTELVPELESLVARHPLHERFWAQLVTALARCGRQRDALQAFQRARAALDEHAGLEPGAELRAAEAAVLAGHDTVHRPRANGSFVFYTDAAGKAHHVPLQPGSSYTIGRHASADISLDWDARASRIHARLTSSGEHWTLEDAGSTNGTFVKNRRIDEPTTLRHGDVFLVGGTAITLRTLGNALGLAGAPSELTMMESVADPSA